MHCPGGNATDPIWRVLASSDWICSWTPLKPQQSNPNPNPLANQLWCIDFLTPPTPLILPHRLPAIRESLIPWISKTVSRFMQDTPKAFWSIPYVSVAFFASLKHNFIAYRSSSRPDCIFENHQLWQECFSGVYFNSCCSCSFKPEIIKIVQSSHKMYSTLSLSLSLSLSHSLSLYTCIYIYIYIHWERERERERERESDISILLRMYYFLMIMKIWKYFLP